jgi:HlyD family secretion protein
MSDPQPPQRPDLSELRIDRDADGGGGGRRALLIAAMILVAAAAVIVLLIARTRPAEVTVAAARAPSSPGETTILNASGYITPRRRATVAAKITGRVTEVLVDEGMPVHAGQVLARLDDSDAQRRLAAVRADRDVARASLAELHVALADAERTLQRTRDLREQGVVGQQELDTATTAVESIEAQIEVAKRNVDAAEAQVAVAEQDLENYTIRAPFDGIAVSKDAQPGEMVSPISAGGGFTRTGISTIVDMASLEVEVDVNESFIAKVTPGQRVESVLDAYPDWRIPSSVRTIIPTADRQKATVKVRISFDALDPRILPDMGVKVSFLDEQPQTAREETPAARALMPAAAVRTIDGRPVVFVVTGDRVERRAVTLGRTVGSDVEVAAGITPGERVVVNGPADLEDGQQVRVNG